MQIAIKQNQPRSAVERLFSFIRDRGYEIVRMNSSEGYQIVTCVPNKKDNPDWLNSVVLRQVIGGRN